MILKTSNVWTFFKQPASYAVLLTLVCVALIGPGGCAKKAPETIPVVEVVGCFPKGRSHFLRVGRLPGRYGQRYNPCPGAGIPHQAGLPGRRTIKKGQVLFEIDPRTFEASRNQAKAELARTQARLKQTEANLARIRPLAAQNAVSKKDLDDAIGAEQSAQASVLSAKAAFDKASLDLGFTKIKSPIDGIAGIAKAQIGNLVGPGQSEELTTVSTINPIKAYISISEQEYLKLRESRRNNQEQARKIPLELILSNGKTYPQKGEFAFGDRQIDVRTGTIRLTTIFPNPDNLLRPGQFARVRAMMGTKKNALLIPQRAVKEMQGKYLIAVVGADNKVVIRQVKAAEEVGSLWVIDKGLQAGDKVVSEGIQKVKDGMVVSPKPFTEPPSQSTPDGSAQERCSAGSAETRDEQPATPSNPDKEGSNG